MQKNHYYLFIVVFVLTNLFSLNQLNGQIKIGEQIWMNTNLNVSKFQNGDPIKEAKTKEEWVRANTDRKPAWCYYNNNSQNGLTYGKLYNWYAINDPRGLAPKGWHIPSKSDWDELIEYIEKKGEDVSESLKAKTGWKKYDVGGYQAGSDCEYCDGTGKKFSKLTYKYITCVICGGSGGDKRYINKRTVSGNGTNKIGFSAMPGSNRWDDGDFNEVIGLLAGWWSSTEYTKDDAYDFYINAENSISNKNSTSKKGYGASVRLIKDNPAKIEKERIALELKKKKEEEEIQQKLNEARIIDSIEKATKEKLIGQPIKIGKLYVSQFNFPNTMNFDLALQECNKLGPGWRLPTFTELFYFTNNNLSNNKLPIGSYWVDFQDTYGKRGYLFKFDGKNTNGDYAEKDKLFYVRPVKSE